MQVEHFRFRRGDRVVEEGVKINELVGDDEGRHCGGDSSAGREVVTCYTFLRRWRAAGDGRLRRRQVRRWSSGAAWSGRPCRWQGACRGTSRRRFRPGGGAPLKLYTAHSM